MEGASSSTLPATSEASGTKHSSITPLTFLQLPWDIRLLILTHLDVRIASYTLEYYPEGICFGSTNLFNLLLVNKQIHAEILSALNIPRLTIKIPLQTPRQQIWRLPKFVDVRLDQIRYVILDPSPSPDSGDFDTLVPYWPQAPVLTKIRSLLIRMPGLESIQFDQIFGIGTTSCDGQRIEHGDRSSQPLRELSGTSLTSLPSWDSLERRVQAMSTSMGLSLHGFGHYSYAASRIRSGMGSEALRIKITFLRSPAALTSEASMEVLV